MEARSSSARSAARARTTTTTTNASTSSKNEQPRRRTDTDGAPVTTVSDTRQRRHASNQRKRTDADSSGTTVKEQPESNSKAKNSQAASNDSDEEDSPISIANLKNFNARDFVERLSRKQLFKMRTEEREKEKAAKYSRNTKDVDFSFNLEPLQAIFDEGLSSLKRMAELVDRKMVEIAKECAEEEARQKKKLEELSATFEHNYGNFTLLDLRISKVGNIAVRIGERLNAVEQQRSKAAEAKLLITYFAQLNGDDLEAEEQEDAEGSGKPAASAPKPTPKGKPKSVLAEVTDLKERTRLLKKLSSMTQDLSLERTQRGKAAVEKQCNELENMLLAEFDDARQKKDFGKMKACADILFEFNGGESCVRNYINKMEMFFSEEALKKDETLASMQWQSSTAARRQSVTENADLPTAKMNAFFSSIVSAIAEEYQVISRVFPVPGDVMNILLSRVFDQRINHFLESTLSPLEGSPPQRLLYLRQLATAWDKANELVENLSQYDVGSINFANKLDEVFCNYLSTYTDHECECLRFLLEKKIRQVKEEEAETLRRMEQERQRAKVKKSKKELQRDQQNQISIPLETLLYVFHAADEAVGRCKKLSRPDQLPINLSRLFTTLMGYIVPLVNTRLDSALAALQTKASRVVKLTPYLHFVEVISHVNNAVLLLQKHFHLSVLPSLRVSESMCTQCAGQLATFLEGLEGRVNIGIERLLWAIIVYIEHHLGELQKKNDFRPKEEEAELATKPTPACLFVTSYVARVYKEVHKCLDGKNIEVFLEELGMRLHRSLLAHFKKYTVLSGLGGFRLMQDLAMYRDCVKGFRIPEVDEKFEQLRELANIFTVRPENLKNLIEESTLSQLDRFDVLEYIKLRSDYKSTWLHTYKLLELHY